MVLDPCLDFSLVILVALLEYVSQIKRLLRLLTNPAWLSWLRNSMEFLEWHFLEFLSRE